jgi:deoxyribonuclease (pyrimidine dimer)
VTRVNLVPVEELHHKHLVAEYRENPRVFGLVRAAQARGLTPDRVVAPAVYTLGPGHVKFFYSKLGFLLLRQLELIAEMQNRGYMPGHRDPTSLLIGVDRHWVNDWSPDEAAVAVSRARLQERLVQMGVTS